MRVMRTDNAVGVWPDDAMKNFIFYIFSMYEFSHSLGHSRPSHSAPVPINVRYAPNSDRFLRRSEMMRCATSGHSRNQLEFPVHDVGIDQPARWVRESSWQSTDNGEAAALP